MSKVFGYSKTGSSSKGWFNTDHYSDKEIESINDPEGGIRTSMPTAIPSPFARIDLVKTAFRNIVNSPDLKIYSKDGKVVVSRNDEKLVSDSLDIAELLFNYNEIKSDIRIIIWDKDVEIKKLKSGSDEHRRFGETLELYLDQDKDSYNFDLLTRFYLIEYKHEIIGCTSPSTLFFATANDLSNAQINLTGDDTLFDNDYNPLYKRDPEFQKYLYCLFLANSTISTRMKDFAEYLEKNKKILKTVNPVLFGELNSLTSADYKKSFANLTVEMPDSNANVEVLGANLGKRKSEDIIDFIAENSDFRIQPTKLIAGNPPLVLQNDFSEEWQYAKEKWNRTTKVPYFEPKSPNDRQLPGLIISYPFLTVSDFLEPYLLRMVYPINSEKFFDGNLVTEVGDDSKGYLLPLKKQFFDYFSADDLKKTGVSKPSIKMIQGIANSVTVVLKIPVVKGDYITLKRTYFDNSSLGQIAKADERDNKGVIVEQQVGLTLFPFIKTSNKKLPSFYRIQLIDRNVAGHFKNSKYSLKYFSDNPSSEITSTPRDRTPKNADASTHYYVLDQEFDFIQISNSSDVSTSGIIIPKWQPYNEGSEVFSFAVDFGTTNTHIEYQVGKDIPKPFDITDRDIQIATLFHPSKTSENFSGSSALAIREMVEIEFIPELIGKDSIYRFPHRTVIAQNTYLNLKQTTFTLADFNIPFIYERRTVNDKITSNLKWAKSGDENATRIEKFLENILMLLRNKVLLNNGNLSATRLIWFYPSSMKIDRKNKLEELWRELFAKYFNLNNQDDSPLTQTLQANEPVGITESIAPFFYFKPNNQLHGGEVISIDIGGGTTDVVIFKGEKPLLLTSFKFAANSIFGDGFSESGAAMSNNLVKKYSAYYENLFEKNKLYELKQVLNSIKQTNSSEDINTFFFSIENNPKTLDKNLYSYNSKLAADEDLKILFLYFYSAIIYHIAKLMKVKNLELPQHLVFSGTGSKILNIITPNSKTLSKFSVKIFEGVYNQTYNQEGLTIVTEKDKPKEVTCKGGLLSNIAELQEIDINEIKAILTCLEDQNITELKINDLTESLKNNIIVFVTEFNDFFLKLNQEFSFMDNFGVTNQSLRIFRTEVNKYLKDFLERGLDYNRKLDGGNNSEGQIEETLFFYPIINTINNLIGHLASLSSV